MGQRLRRPSAARTTADETPEDISPGKRRGLWVSSPSYLALRGVGSTRTTSSISLGIRIGTRRSRPGAAAATGPSLVCGSRAGVGVPGQSWARGMRLGRGPFANLRGLIGAGDSGRGT
ncbi:hypothetical protein NL676_025822 [Syzygium grande]|nr:hypothetical protein NL676_025822 [Syzygium grande]